MKGQKIYKHISFDAYTNSNKIIEIIYSLLKLYTYITRLIIHAVFPYVSPNRTMSQFNNFFFYVFLSQHPFV